MKNHEITIQIHAEIQRKTNGCMGLGIFGCSSWTCAVANLVSSVFVASSPGFYRHGYVG